MKKHHATCGYMWQAKMNGVHTIVVKWDSLQMPCIIPTMIQNSWNYEDLHKACRQFKNDKKTIEYVS